MIIGVWGDSIVYGSCDSDGLGWVGRLRKSLPSDDDHQVYNFGVCGETSSDVLKRFQIEAQAVNSNVSIFAVGINDTKYQGDSDVCLVPLDQFTENLKELIVQAQRFSHEIYIISPTHVDEKWRSVRGSRFFNERINEYGTAIAHVARDANIPFIDVSKVLDTGADLADGLHPNAIGYQKLFEVISKQIAKS